MEKNYYKELRKEYTDEEIADAFILPSTLSDEEQKEMDKEISKFIKMKKKEIIESKKYKIKVYYETGDSESSSNISDIVEIDWNDLDIAKENLKRIKEHYLWYKEINRYRQHKSLEYSEPEWHKGIKEDYLFKYVTDEGLEVQMHCPWIGYFEKLQMAEIIIDSEHDDMRFEIN